MVVRIVRPEVEMPMTAVGKDDDLALVLLFAYLREIDCGADRMR